VASVGPTINRAVLLAKRVGRFLLSSFFISFSAIGKRKKKKKKYCLWLVFSPTNHKTNYTYPALPYKEE